MFFFFWQVVTLGIFVKRTQFKINTYWPLHKVVENVDKIWKKAVYSIHKKMQEEEPKMVGISKTHSFKKVFLEETRHIKKQLSEITRVP